MINSRKLVILSIELLKINIYVWRYDGNDGQTKRDTTKG